MFRRFITVLLLAAGLGGERVRALPDYLVDKWDTEDNLPSSTVTSIVQTPDGYLWIGTYNGLARFDGARFVTFDPINTPELGQARVQGLYLDAEGTLWINTFRGGLTSYRQGIFRNEWPDQPSFDLHTTLVYSTTNEVVFVTQFGDVLRRATGATNWNVATPPPSASRSIFQCADAEGRLWFLTRDGRVAQFFRGQYSLLPEDGGLAGSKIYTLVRDDQGRVWAGAENEIALWDGREFAAMTPTNGAADIEPRGLFPLRSGDLWVLDGDRLRRMSGRSWVQEIPEWRGLLGAASGRAMGAREDRAGGLWFNHYGNGLFHIGADGQFQRVTTADNLPSDRVGAWFQSRDGGIWAGVDRGGLARLRDRRFHVVGAADGLGSRTALSVCADQSGEMWIGTAGGGLCRWSNGVVARYPVGVSASANLVFSIAQRPADGAVWVSAGEGEDLYQLVAGRLRRVSWDVHGVKVIFFDRQNRVWVGLKAGLAVWAGEVKQSFNVNSTGFMPPVRAFAESPDGTVWAGADDGTLFACTPEKLTPHRPTDPLAEQAIYSLIADGNGTVWAGTFRGGLLRFKDGKFFRFTAQHGLPVDVISQIVDDGRGRLWLGTHQGIYSVAKSALDAVADGQRSGLDFVAYGRHDGMASVECADGYQPACARTADGKLWFATVRGGAVWVDPAEVIARSTPPPVVIEELRADGELVNVAAAGSGLRQAAYPLTIPPGRKQLDFRFTALSFDGGEKARFRYRVDGLDPDWVDWDTRRTVQLRNLLPGEYRFNVIACNSQGEWNEAGASLAFVVQPHFYQTLSFRLAVAALLIGGLSYAVRRAGTRKYRRKLALLEQQHAIERDRARIAKDIHDDIGAGLTQITLLTELARRQPDQTANHLERITDSARTLTKAMDEIVWAVDPQHDTFDGLMDYISAYAEDFLRVAGIRCRMELPLALPPMRVDAELRYNLFLALKETLNNIVKHARATEVWIRLTLAEKSFTLSVEDNGQGLLAGAEAAAATGRISSGSGLGNLDKRLATVGGRCDVQSTPGQGTRVAMIIPAPQLSSPVMAIGQPAP